MNNNNYLSQWGNIAQIISVVPLLLIAFRGVRNWMLTTIPNNYMVTIIMILLSTTIFLCIRLLLIKKTKINNEDEINRKKITIDNLRDLNLSESNPYILIVDDDKDVLDSFQERLSPTFNNLCLSPSIPHQLMGREFDIIIADIANAGFKGKMSDIILKEIKHNYPYIFICAISSFEGYKDRAKELDNFIKKDRKNAYIDQTIEEINSYRDQLCHTKDRWHKIEAEMKSQHRTNEEIEQIKEKYIHKIMTRMI